MQTKWEREDDVSPPSTCVCKLVPSYVIPSGFVFVVFKFLSVKIEYFKECVVREYADARIAAYWLESQ